LDGRPPEKTRLLLKEVSLYCQRAPSFGWDVKPRPWLRGY